MADTIICPQCKYEIAVTETLSEQLREELRKDFDADAKKKAKALSDREDALRKQAEELDAKQQAFEQELASRLAKDREKLKKEAAEKAKEELGAEIADYQSQLTDAKAKLQAAQKGELELRKQKRELEEEREAFDLTLARRLDEEKDKLKQDARTQLDQEHKLKDAEKDKLITDMRAQIDDLKKKSEQGSQQLQGEVMEIELEDLLRRQFPDDTITQVPKGTHGGDVVQVICDGPRTECGIILWESKRTKAWSDGWLPKLRDDQRATKAQIAILASFELPKGLKHFGCVDGVWVTHWDYAMALAVAVRAGLVEAAKARLGSENKHDKMEMLYSYLSGPEFRLHVEGIIEAFTTLRGELDRERKAMNRIWKSREKQIERVLLNTSAMYGSLQGIIGSKALPTLQPLALPTADESDGGEASV